MRKKKKMMMMKMSSVFNSEILIYDIVKKAVSPPGWKKTVEKMKDHPEIDNPFALAWSMSKKKKGDDWGEGKLKKKPKPHYKEPK